MQATSSVRRRSQAACGSASLCRSRLVSIHFSASATKLLNRRSFRNQRSFRNRRRVFPEEYYCFIQAHLMAEYTHVSSEIAHHKTQDRALAGLVIFQRETRQVVSVLIISVPVAVSHRCTGQGSRPRRNAGISAQARSRPLTKAHL